MQSSLHWPPTSQDLYCLNNAHVTWTPVWTCSVYTRWLQWLGFRFWSCLSFYLINLFWPEINAALWCVIVRDLQNHSDSIMADLLWGKSTHTRTHTHTHRKPTVEGANLENGHLIVVQSKLSTYGILQLSVIQWIYIKEKIFPLFVGKYEY